MSKEGTMLYTIGHSTHLIERFISLLRQHDITAICDVRTSPFSRYNPQFNRDDIKRSLRENSIAYIFLGKELGARSEDPACYINGKVQYDRLAATALFKNGIERVRIGMKDFRIALMCAEKDPIACHRTILVSRHLESSGISVQHILEDGSLESHAKTMTRLLKQLHLPDQDLFNSHEDMLKQAYRIQGDRIAYNANDVSTESFNPIEA